MSTALVRQDSVITTLDEMQRVARLLAVSEYFDAKGDNNGAIAKLSTKILAGRELGYGPFASVNGIHIIQGRPALGANLMASAVKASGRYDYRIKRIDDGACEIEFFERMDGKRESLGVSSFTKQDAVAAKTQNMDKFARNMLFARAMSNGVKWFCPDVFNGNAVYVPEELGAEVDGDGNVIDTTARVIVTTGTTEVTTTTNGNGHGGTNGDTELKTWQTWDAPATAKAWAVECGACENEFEANGSFAKLVKEQFGGRLNAQNIQDVYAAFYAHQMEKLGRQAQEAVKDAPEMVPA